MNIKKFVIAMLTFAMTPHLALAGEYLVSASTATTVTYAGRTYTRGIDLLSSLADINGLPEGSTVRITAGTWDGNVTVNTKSLTLLGANAWRDGRAVARHTPTVITGKLTVGADGVTVNGFDFTGAGCVTNTQATTAAPLKNLTYCFNYVNNATTTALLVGKAYSGADANVATAHRRYANISVTNNTFTGDNTHYANFINIHGAYGTTAITDNRFTSGGRSIQVGNAQGTVNIRNNNFANVGTGAALAADGAAWCIYLRYIAYSNSTTVNICGNDFNNCQGQGSVYSLIRFQNGDNATDELKAVNCKINMNYNVFRGKKKVQTTATNFNYLFFTSAGYAIDARIDARYNRYDNSEYAIGMIQPDWASSQQRYFGGSNMQLLFSSTAGTTLSYYKDATGAEVRDVRMKTPNLAQSFDVDDATGDIYFVHLYPNELSGLNLESEEPYCVMRYYKNAEGKMAKQYMYLDHAGHAGNMAVTRHNGKVYIATGGKSIMADIIKSKSSTLFPFVAGATADLDTTCFTYNGKKYDIIQFENTGKRYWDYPSIDNDHNLFLERSVKGNYVYFAIYDLDEVFEKGSAAKPIKMVNLATKGKEGGPVYTSSTAANADLVAADTGFQTWPAQGFTVHGDWLYLLEGVAKTNGTSAVYPAGSGTKIPTIFLTTYNWRDGTWGYRLPILKTMITGLNYGEPEGIKIHRDANGRPHMLLHVITRYEAGTHFASNVFDYAMDTENGLSRPIAKPVITLDDASLTVTADDDTAAPLTIVGYGLTNCAATPSVTITGSGSRAYSIKSSTFNQQTGKGSVTLAYAPGADTGTHDIRLRVSAPYAADVSTFIHGINQTTAVTDIATDDVNLAEPVYYTLQGIRVQKPTPGNVYIRKQGTHTQKIIL